MEDRKLTYQETETLTGVKRATLYTLVFQKRIPHVRLGKRLVRFSKNAVEDWMKQNEVRVGVEGSSK